MKADPSKATTADAMSELGRGSNISRTMPMRGAPITIDVNEYFFEGDEKSSPKDPDEEESLHLWRNSAFAKHSGQYSATVTSSHLLALPGHTDGCQAHHICLLQVIPLSWPNALT